MSPLGGLFFHLLNAGGLVITNFAPSNTETVRYELDNFAFGRTL